MENTENTEQGVSYETLSTETGTGAYPADNEQRQAILDSISLRDGVDLDDLLSKLAESVELAHALHERQKIIPSAAQLRKEIERLKKAYDALGVYAKRELRTYLGTELDEAIDEVLSIDNWSDLMREKGGKKRNEAAQIFILHCARYWHEYSRRSLPRTCSVRSPFYKFVIAALPQDVLPSRHYSDLTTIVNQALSRFYGPHPFAPANIL